MDATTPIDLRSERPDEEQGRGVLAEAGRTLALAWPIVLTNVSQMVMGATDLAFLGRVSAEAVAGVVLAQQVFYVLLVGGFGLSFGTAALLAQEYGAKKRRVTEMRRTLRQSLWAGLFIAIPSWGVLAFTGPILLALGQEEEAAAIGGRYMAWDMWGLLPFLWFASVRGFTAAVLRPVPPMVIAGVGIVVNALLGWLLILGALGAPRLEEVGAGIASTVANLVMVALLLGWVSLDGTLRRWRLLGRWWRMDWQRQARIWRMGLPIMAAMIFEVGVFSVAALLMGRFGANAVAAHAAILTIAALTFMVPMGIGQAATTRVGHATGAGDRTGALRAGVVALLLGAGFMAMTAAMFLVVPATLAGIVLGEEAREAVPLAVSLAAAAAAFQVFDGLQTIAAGSLRGMGDVRLPMWIAGFGYWAIGIPLGAGLGLWGGFGPIGIWIGLVVALAIVAVLMVARFLWLAGGRRGPAAVRAD